MDLAYLGRKVLDNFLEVAAYKAFLNPMSVWRPRARPQEKWIKLVGSHTDDRPMVKVWSKANKVGGTMTTIAILSEIIFGPSSHWFDFGVFKKWPYPKNFWIDSTDSALKEVIIPFMRDLFPRGKYEIDKSGKTMEYHWKCDGGFNIFVKTYDTPEDKLESALLGGVIFSEPPPYTHYKAIPARMPQGGLVLMDMTPVVKTGGRSLSWVYDELEEEGKCDILYTDIEEVCKDCNDGYGLWDHKYVLNLIKGYDKDERDARARGQYTRLSGLVYKNLSEEIHFIKDFEFPPNWQVTQIIDPHDRKPPAACWIAVSPTGDHYVIDEYPKYEKGKGYETLKDDPKLIGQHVRSFLAIEKGRGWNITRRIMDPRFGNKIYRNTMRTVKEEYDASLRANGSTNLYSLGDTSDLDPGHKKVKEMIYHDDKVRPRLYVFQSCMNTWRFLTRYSYIDEPESDNKDIPIKVEQKFKDFADLIRYYALEKVQFTFYEVEDTKLPWRERLKRKSANTSFWRKYNAGNTL